MLNLSLFKHAVIAAALLLPACFANAHEYKSADLQITHPWSQELPPNAPTVAAYFVIHNTGSSADRLLSADTPIAGGAELHQHVMQGDFVIAAEFLGCPAETELAAACSRCVKCLLYSAHFPK